MQFDIVTIDKLEHLKKYYEGSFLEGSYYTLPNIYLWRNYLKGTFITEMNDMLAISGYYDEKRYFMFPLGNGNIKKTVEDIINEFGKNFVFTAITNEHKTILEQLFPGVFEFKRSRNMDNYVYDTNELIELSGKKYHSKRNHINKFTSLYNWEYKTLTEDLIEECIRTLEAWCEKKNCKEDEAMNYEVSTMKDALIRYKELNFKGGIILVDGEICAFSLGELINPETALIHVEKANTDFQGAFNIINQQFLLHEWNFTKYVNREEDMGIEGLRKSKLSYKPCKMIEFWKGSVQ